MADMYAPVAAYPEIFVNPDSRNREASRMRPPSSKNRPEAAASLDARAGTGEVAEVLMMMPR
jgi:hypothetical protein